MILSTSATLRVITSTATTVDVVASYADDDGTTITPGSTRAAITTATPTDVVAAPGSGVRVIRSCTITNRGSTTAVLSVVERHSGTDYYVAEDVSLADGESLVLDGGAAWRKFRRGVPVESEGSTVAGLPVPLYKIGTAAEAAGQWYCYGKDAGSHGVWSPGTPGINGRVTDGTAAGDAGCVRVANAPGGSANYLEQYVLAAAVASTFMFCDVLWCNTGITVTTTTAQAITSPAWPARDADGATSGRQVMVGILVTAATTNGASIATITMSYTNSAGAAGRTATIASFPATAVIGTVVWFALAAGDEGVQSIQSITLGTSLVTGSISLIAATWLPQVVVTVANASGVMAPVSPTGRPAAGVRLYDGCCLLLLSYHTATTALTPQGTLLIGTR